MEHRISALLPMLCLATTLAHAQQADGTLNAAQAHGRQVFAQSCGVCHLQPAMGAKTYGPQLNRTSGAGNDEAMRTFILYGSERMPAFRYYLKPTEIDAIIAYLKTVPAQSASATNAAKGEME